VASQKILIVDDEPDVVSLLERMLAPEGYEVLKAYDGIGALDVAATERPDLILLDIMMPTMSGYEVCEQLKADPETQHIPVVCITSAHTIEARSHSIQAGAVTLVTKPFMPTELLAQIRRHLPQVESVS